jgi:predicted dienelactone hydrolase
MHRLNRLIATAMAVSIVAAPAPAQENRVDLVRPDAPELAAYGPNAIGVRTVEVVNAGQPDILNVKPGKPIPTYDRKLTLEIWYPAEGTASDEARGVYQDVYLRDGTTQVTLSGRAVRDAPPLTSGDEAPYPLIIVSHGYPGNRFLLSHLSENLASKGNVVAAIDHTDSNYDDLGAFGSTLVNRPLDQRFVLDEMERLSGEVDHFLSGLVDASTTAVIGYSMGGYGAVITAGAGVTRASTGFEWGAPEGTLAVNVAGSESHEALVDARVKAVVAIAPWGMNRGFWDEAGLAGIEKPIFIIAGSADDVSIYEDIRRIYEGAVNADRYLLTFENANHNAAAPIAAPSEVWTASDGEHFGHYSDPVWDTVRMNNITQHFVTAFLGRHIKGDGSMDGYLDLIEEASSGVYAANEDGTFRPGHTYWKGFEARSAVGLRLEHEEPARAAQQWNTDRSPTRRANRE